MRKVLMSCALLTFTFLLPGVQAVAKEDSSKSQTPDVVISKELAEKSRILILKDRGIADSLFRLQTPPARTEFELFLKDTAISVEVKTKAEFRRYWNAFEHQEGFQEMRAQFAAADHDKTRIPRVYLFDSSVVVYPGWVVMRRKRGR